VAKRCPRCDRSFDDAAAFCPFDRTTLQSASGDDPLIGSVVADKYLVVEKLGQGGMGCVYRAQHVALQAPRALKVLRPGMAELSDAVARFCREAANGTRVQHRNVAQVYDSGETPEGMHYLVLEHVAGDTLKRIAERDGPLPPERVAALVSQIADGLDAIHAAGIVHRDLSPDNVVLARGADGAETPKIVDFGIAKGSGPGQQVTATGLVSGKCEYMSPEQLTDRDVDPRTDVYALGLIVVHLLTGRLPFVGETPKEAMLLRLHEPPLGLAELAPDRRWAPALQAVVARALARRPEERFATAGALAAALREAVAAPAAPAAVSSRRDGSFLRRHARTIGAAAVLAAIAFVAALALGRAADTPSAEQTVAIVPDASPPAPPAAEPARAVPATDSVSPSLPPSAERNAAPDADPADHTAAEAPPAGGSATDRGVPSEPPSTAQGYEPPPRAAEAEATPSTAPDATREAMTRINRVSPEALTLEQGRAFLRDAASLLPRLSSAEDSAVTLMRMAEVHALTLEETAPACALLERAGRVTRSPEQRAHADRYASALECPQ
jgi:serine/threonine-protein kinase